MSTTMIEYPTLETLGIHSIDQVVKYSLSREPDVDVIKVHYKRESGSLLARSKKFYFSRGHQADSKNSAQQVFKSAHVSTQYLLALEELRKLISLQPEQKKRDKKKELLQGLDKLEAVIESKFNQIHQQIDDYKK